MQRTPRLLVRGIHATALLTASIFLNVATAQTPAPVTAPVQMQAPATAAPAAPHALLSTPQPSAEQLKALPPATAQLVEKGRMVALASDCAGCHTAPGSGKPFAGGYPLESPLGKIVATNITPSQQFGLGNYTQEELSAAVRDGKRKDGAHLYPAMPYDSYAKMSDEDLAALYAYLMHGVPAIEQPVEETKLPFPFNMRWSMAFWNLLYLDKTRFQADTSKSPEWNRGAYLTEGLEHCSACHTPRNTLMAADHSKSLAGSPLGAWYAPNITSDPISGIGGWSVEELVQYLKTGRAEGKGQAAGGMAEAVENSLQFLPESDLRAIAVYLKSTPPIRDAADAKLTVAAHDSGAAHSDEAAMRGNLPQNSVAPLTSGASLFSGYCASCHQASGSGTPDQAYPSLYHNTATGMSRPDNLIAAILFGVQRNANGVEVLMPRFDEKSYVDPLTNEQIAAIANHVLKHYGPATSSSVTPQDVQQARQGGPQPFLAKAQPYIAPAMVVIGLLVVLLLWWLVRRRRRGYQRYL